MHIYHNLFLNNKIIIVVFKEHIHDVSSCSSGLLSLIVLPTVKASYTEQNPILTAFPIGRLTANE